MLRELRIATMLFLLLTVLTGAAYPGLVTVIATLAFRGQASGSVVQVQGKVVGSRLVGQPFSSPRYFWGRPSATEPTAYNGAISSGSNHGPLNPALHDSVSARIAALRAGSPTGKGAVPVPVDLVTASASGLDPHISIAAAQYQVPRIARARGVSADLVRQLVDAATEGRTLGFLGEPRVNVLLLNLALDRES